MQCRKKKDEINVPMTLSVFRDGMQCTETQNKEGSQTRTASKKNNEFIVVKPVGLLSRHKHVIGCRKLNNLILLR